MISDILIGLITGMVSGLVVYFATKHREEKYQTYMFWNGFLFDALGNCEVWLPTDALKMISKVGDKDSTWYKAIYDIFDDINPYGHEDRDMTEKECRIFDNVGIAFNELQKWKKKNHLH